MTVVSAPGKAFLIGEYAVLHGAPALVAAVGVRAVAHLPRPQYGETAAPDSPFVAAAIRSVGAFLEAKHLLPPDPAAIPTITTLEFTAGERKLGLGSSAAVTAAMVGYHLARAGLDLRTGPVREKALALAREAHTAAQGGTGSGADVAASVWGGILHFRAGDARPMSAPSWLAFGFFDAGAPASTSALVDAVARGARTHPGLHASAIEKLRSASARFIAALELDAEHGLEAIGSACRMHNEGLRDLERLADQTFLTPTILRVIEACEGAGIAAKPSGAGGGDLVVVFGRRQADIDRVGARVVREFGIPLIGNLGIGHPGSGAEGLRVEHQLPVQSRISGLHRRTLDQRRIELAAASGLPLSRFSAADPSTLDLDAADAMIENAIGVMGLPIGVATNFRINGRDFLVPMCVEEASVVAAASNAALMVRAGGGFVAHSDPPWMIAQIQLVGTGDASEVEARLRASAPEILALADLAHPRLLERGGGARELEVRVLDGSNVVVHVLVDCQDAMGANLLNTVAESVSPLLEALTGWRAVLRILSNLADRRASHVSARVPPKALASADWPGDKVAELVVEASRFAELDPYRATTHNKGIMNGADAVVLATGNDWRAMEAAAHAYAARSGKYSPLATWRVAKDGWLEGHISLPTAVGVVGGATRSHPCARLALDLLGNPSGTKLGQVIAAAGLASNLAALRALATDGIQRGHMTLHARAVAMAAGATPTEIPTLAAALIDCGEIKPERARALLENLRHREN